MTTAQARTLCRTIEAIAPKLQPAFYIGEYGPTVAVSSPHDLLFNPTHPNVRRVQLRNPLEWDAIYCALPPSLLQFPSPTAPTPEPPITLPSPVGHWCSAHHPGAWLPHCWHVTGATPAGQTQRWCVLREQCCWCGSRRERTVGPPELGMHGPHAPEGVEGRP